MGITEFRGGTVAIDTYCWLHKGATACADVLARGEDTDVYVNFCMKYVNMLLKYDIKPILVFDGNNLPAKKLTEERRRETRKNAKVRAAELLRLGRKDEAWNYFRQSIDITPRMALNLIKECRKNNIDCIVAPYESDAQLAYLNLKGIADVVITEDSDLVLFGCTNVFYKIDLNGNGRLVEKEKLPICMKLKPDRYTFDKFRYMCILSGCDYLDSLPGIGLKKALKFVSLTAETDPHKFLDKVPKYLNMKNQVVTDEYKENFMVADATFKHQLVYDPLAKKLTHLTDPGLCGTRPEYCKNAGEFFDENTAYQVAIGNLNPSSYEKYDDWSPTKNWNNSFHSIWSNTFIKKKSRKEQKEQTLKEQKQKIEIRHKIESQIDEFESQLQAESDEFDSQLRIYYEKPVLEQKNDNVIETTSEKTEVEKDSPVLKKKFVNPFLKKKLSKFEPTEIDTNVVVKSRYFKSKSEDLSIEITNDDDCKKRKMDVEEILENHDHDVEVVEDKLEKALKISSSQNSQTSSKKPKRCRSVGLSRNLPKNQMTLHTLFANIKPKQL